MIVVAEVVAELLVALVLEKKTYSFLGSEKAYEAKIDKAFWGWYDTHENNIDNIIRYHEEALNNSYFEASKRKHERLIERAERKREETY